MIESPNSHSGSLRSKRRQSGIALALVLVLIVLLVTAVYAFQHRAIINTTVAKNRIAASKADAAARGALRLAEAAVYMIRVQETLGEGAGDDPAAALAAAMLGESGNPDLWTQFENFPLEFAAGEQVTLSIEELSGRLNLNALVPQSQSDPDRDSEDRDDATDPGEALEYLVLVLKHIVEGIDAPAEDKNYDERALAENLIDYMDGDDTSLGGGREDAYYQEFDPPYRPRNGPFLTFEEIGLVEGVDPLLLGAMRHYITIHPIGGSGGIDLNRAEPWVLPLVYAGPSGDRELLRERTLRQIIAARKDGERICSDTATDPKSCVSLADVGIDEGSIFPETVLPAPVAVFRVVATASVGNLTREIEAIYDTRPLAAPQLLSWRRLRGSDSAGSR